MNPYVQYTNTCMYWRNEHTVYVIGSSHMRINEETLSKWLSGDSPLHSLSVHLNVWLNVWSLRLIHNWIKIHERITLFYFSQTLLSWQIFSLIFLLENTLKCFLIVFSFIWLIVSLTPVSHKCLDQGKVFMQLRCLFTQLPICHCSCETLCHDHGLCTFPLASCITLCSCYLYSCHSRCKWVLTLFI